jgi:outer membrane protein
MRKTIIFIVTTLLHTQIHALKIEEALVSGYNNYNKLKTDQNNFIKSLEDYAKTVSGFLPTISFDTSIQDGEIGDKLKQYNGRTENNLNIKQNLFNGFKSSTDLAMTQILFKAERSNYYSKEEKAFIDLIKIYLDYYEALESFKASETSIMARRKNLSAVQEQLKLGETTKTDMAAAQAELFKAETEKLDKYSTLQDKKATFEQAFNIISDNLELPEIPEHMPQSLEELKEKSLNNNNFITAKYSYDVQKLSVKSAYANMLPNVDLNLSVGKAGNYQTRTGIASVNTTNPQMTTRLSVTIPIYQSGQEYSLIRKAKNSLRESALRLDDITKEINYKTSIYWEAFNATKSAIISADASVKYAKIAAEGAQFEEKVGTKTILNVLEQQKNLYDAELKKIAIHKNLILTAYNIKFLAGQLTARALNLKVDYFTPEEEFKKFKKRIFIDINALKFNDKKQ